MQSYTITQKAEDMGIDKNKYALKIYLDYTQCGRKILGLICLG